MLYVLYKKHNWNIKTKEGSKLEVMRHILNKPMCIAVFKEDEIDCNVYTSARNKEFNNMLPSISEQCIWLVKPKL